MSGYFHDRLGVGAIVSIEGPSGQFVFDETRDRILLIGGGVGMTPLMSVVRDRSSRPVRYRRRTRHSRSDVRPATRRTSAFAAQPACAVTRSPIACSPRRGRGFTAMCRAASSVIWSTRVARDPRRWITTRWSGC